ncbi:c-type cytochrome [Ramlibacter alkalitolerans]|jgi:cytochrome c5|uniref:Cytochrome c5 family protein n=1 Tax=Ramlibacter alkalitolerans TaxID=2039631 RepID=A0ABS1JN49_9BURK|nr:c-type cytochrome [Ramlibacter alkalitolerans]MBL0425680.1 cytochrome c5 family protein [Ramlibacter alkalitolerans]
MATTAQTSALRATAPAIVVLSVLALSAPAFAVQKAREGRQVVETVCAACHAPGKDGAPKIGDRAAWTPRFAKGIDALIDSAVNGHGGMPARGGVVQLEREELRSAVLYMFNFGLPPVAPPAEVAKADPRHKLVAGTDIYLGAMPAEAMRAGASSKASVPTGKGYYHLNISLADQRTGAQVKDAQVKLRVSDGMSEQASALAPVVANDSVSWGNFFKLTSGGAYNIQAEVTRPGVARPIVTNFEFRAP